MIWEVKIEALQPIIIAEKYSAESAWNTTRFIPGSTWRGAFAELWKYRAGFDHPLTSKFVQDSIFHDAHLENSVLYPVYYKIHKSGGIAKSFLDELVEGTSYKVKTENDVIYTKFGYDEHPIMNTTLGIKISPTRESVEKGKLYTMSSIAEGTIFNTTAVIPEEVLEQVCMKLNNNYQCTLYVGKKRSAGHGKIQITFKPKKGYKEVFQKRVEQLPNNLNDIFSIVLVAKSPLILLDEYLLPTEDLNWSTHIAPTLTNSDGFNSFIDQLGDRATYKTYGYGGIRDGWQQTWNAMRTSEQVLLAGTVHVAKFKGLSESEKELIINAIQSIEFTGVGERVQEGFGQVELLPTIQPISSTSVQQSEEERSTITIRDKEKLLNQAIAFATKTNNAAQISQWQALAGLINPRKELMSKESEEYLDGNVMKTRYLHYLERRMQTTAPNSWKKKLPKTDLQLGEAIRQEIKIIESTFNESEKSKNEAVKIYINFLVREQVRLNLESKENRKR